MNRISLAVCLALILAACGKKESEPVPPATSPAAPVQTTGAPAAIADPADPKLAKLYAQTCKTCHSTPGTGAPQTGDKNAWAPRIAQGMPLMLQHTIQGYKGMPPLGSCMDCTEAEYEALIKFMAGLP